MALHRMTNPEYHKESHRLSSFVTWPSTANATSTVLARIGFFYTGIDDLVKCFSCYMGFRDWKPGDNPKVRHKFQSPSCPLSVNNYDGNVALSLHPNHLNISARVTAVDDADQPKLIEIYFNVCLRNKRTIIFNNGVLKICLAKPNFDLLRRELVRLATYENWSSNACVKSDDLARAGFFYSGSGNKVQCAFCHNFHENWTQCDIPLIEHEKHFPDCVFVRKLDICPNVTKENDLETTEIRLVSPEDEADLSVSVDSDRSKSEPNRPHSTRPLLASLSAAETPKYPEMKSEQLRLETFQGFGVTIPTGQDPKILAEAGFFFVGPSDYCKCFYCDGGLKAWEKNDDPWTEHARWYPRCAFIKQLRGQDFIINAKNDRSTRLQQMQPSRPAATNVHVADGGATARHVDAREIKARLDRDLEKSIIAMGYSRDLVRRVIENQLILTGDDFKNAESLLDAVMNEKEEFEQKKNSTPQSLTAVASIAAAPVAAAAAAVEEKNASDNPVKKLENVCASEIQSIEIRDRSAKAKSKGKRRNKTGKGKSASEESGSVKGSVVHQKETEDVYTLQTEQSLEDLDALSPEEIEAKFLIEENRQLKEARTCKVCMENEVNIVFLPCGHLVCCNICAPELRICAICRALIRGTVKTFLA